MYWGFSAQKSSNILILEHSKSHFYREVYYLAIYSNNTFDIICFQIVVDQTLMSVFFTFNGTYRQFIIGILLGLG